MLMHNQGCYKNETQRGIGLLRFICHSGTKCLQIDSLITNEIIFFIMGRNQFNGESKLPSTNGIIETGNLCYKKLAFVLLSTKFKMNDKPT